MRFRRNYNTLRGFFFANGVVVFGLCIFAFVAQQWYMLIFPLMLLLLMGIVVLAENKWIIVNKEGISCYELKKEQWFCSWDDIELLRISTLANTPTVDIVKCQEAITQAEKLDTVRYYFQLSRPARKAIKAYCKRPILNKTIFKNIMGQWDGRVIQEQIGDKRG